MANLTRSRCVIFTSNMVFPLSLEERHKEGDSLQNCGCFFLTRDNQHTEVFPCKDGAQSTRDGRVTWNLDRAAPINGGAQVAEKCHARRACLDMFPHLVAGERFHPAIQILREVSKEIAAFSGAPSNLVVKYKDNAQWRRDAHF